MATPDETQIGAPDFSKIIWNPNAGESIWAEKQPGANRAGMIRHPTYPFQTRFKLSEAQERKFFKEAVFTEFAREYVRRALPLLGFDKKEMAEILSALSNSPMNFGAPRKYPLWWFGFTPPQGRGSLCGSFWVQRRNGEQIETSTPFDRSAVLLAGLAFSDARGPMPWLGGQGLRLVAHWARQDSYVIARISGLVCTLPRIFAAQRAKLFSGKSKLTQAIIDFLLKTEKVKVLGPFGLNPDDHEIAETGLTLHENFGSLVGASKLDLRINAKTLPNGREYENISYKVSSRLDSFFPFQLTPMSIEPLNAHAVKAEVFRQDPFSQAGKSRFSEVRPDRPSGVLDHYRAKVELRHLKASASSNMVKLTHPKIHFSVRQCLYAGDVSPGQPMSLPVRPGTPPALDIAHVRSNAFAAANAYYRVDDLFACMKRYGFARGDYFKFADASMDIFYRAGLTRGAGRSGNVVNAQVNWMPKWQMPGTPPAKSQPGKLQIRFALADTRCMPRRSPLGIACDPRWSWHEFGHVLNAAATGELEFRFAHSAGDSLAAIMSDPESSLADDRGWRGVTFPWVLSRRRHDRTVAGGWGWNGELYRRERTYIAAGDPGKAGYWAEQILSSTLFNLYLAIGGDATDSAGVREQLTRRGAADYAAYLVMRAIQLLGPDSVVPARTADQFASALIDADIGTHVFAVKPGSAKERRRVGGIHHKVIRWAFELQGLYAPANEAVRPSSPVDLFIDDGRSGGYAPISFAGDSWHVPPSSLWVRNSEDGGTADETVQKNRDNFVYFKAGNLGAQAATAVDVQLWVCKSTHGAEWNNGKWTPLTPTRAQPTTVGSSPAPATLFGAFRWKPSKAGDYFLLAVVTCPGDRANVDPVTGLPCASTASPTRWLAALDNNLGLRKVGVA